MRCAGWIAGWLIAATVAVAPAGANERFAEAQRLAWGGERERARVLLAEILAGDPADPDARVLLARTYAWDKDWEAARRELRTVLDARPTYTDASRALADVELWSGRPDAALAAADAGLAHASDDAELLLRRARALERLDRPDEADAAAARFEAIAPADDRARSLRRRLAYDRLPNEAGVDWIVESFEGDRPTRQDVRFELGRRYDFGTVLGRATLARRGTTDGWQLEADAYPKLPWRSYLYLNAGVGDRLFPTFRTGAEWFKNFDGGWEGSLGFRYLDFDSGDVWIATGSVAKYLGDWWLALRPSYSFKSDGDSRSASLWLRRYFGERWQYAGVQIGFGESLVADPLALGADRFADSRLRLEYQRRIGIPWIVGAAVTYRDEEYSSVDLKSWAFQIGFERWFACGRDRR